MTHFSLRPYSGQFESKGVIERIRRKIEGRLAGGECVVVVVDGAKGLTPEIVERLRKGWPSSKVRFADAHPTLAGRVTKEPRRRRRGL
jgi:hypothetical protein